MKTQFKKAVKVGGKYFRVLKGEYCYGCYFYDADYQCPGYSTYNLCGTGNECSIHIKIDKHEARVLNSDLKET